MSTGPSLDRVQRWMQSVITDPRGVAAGIASAEARQQIPVAADDVETVIPRSAACTSVERLAVYGNAYFARLLECLQAEYAVLAQAVGEEAFQSLAAGYLQMYPSTSYTLGRLGAKLSQYLAETRPPRSTSDAGPDWADFVVDLARLEWTYAEVFDGPGEEGTPPCDGQQLRSVPPAQWGELRLKTTRSLRLLTLQFPVHAAFAAIRRTGELPPLSPRPVTLAVFRRDYVVQRTEITPPQLTLLSALQAGATLDAALHQMLDQHAVNPASLAGDIEHWFQSWTADRILTGAWDGAAS